MIVIMTTLMTMTTTTIRW